MDLSRELDKCDVIRDVLELRGADASFDLAKILVRMPFFDRDAASRSPSVPFAVCQCVLLFGVL